MDMHWPGDILDGMLTQIGEADRKLLRDMLAHGGADTNLAGIGESFEPRGDIDAVAENIVALHDDVAHVDADAEPDALTFVDVGIAAIYTLLHHNGAADRIDNRGKLDEEAVACSLDDAALMLRDQRIDKFLTMALQRGERP